LALEEHLIECQAANFFEVSFPPPLHLNSIAVQGALFLEISLFSPRLALQGVPENRSKSLQKGMENGFFSTPFVLPSSGTSPILQLWQ
jgi:hypothetical protein